MKWMKRLFQTAAQFANAELGPAEIGNIADAGEADLVTFTNALTVESDGWAQLAPFGDFAGRAHFVNADGSVSRRNATQRLDKASADEMVANFKSPLQRIKRYFTGCPIYVGHPDMPGDEGKYPDATPKGIIADLAVRNSGLFCKPIFTSEGSDLVESKKFRAFSGRWSSKYIGDHKGLPVFRPDVLKSAGLTNHPNLPVELLNEAEASAPAAAAGDSNTMNKTKIIALLKTHGIEIANEASEEQLEAALGKLGEKAASVAQLANEATTAKAGLTTAQATLTTLTKDKETLAQEFANERKARVEMLLDLGLHDGRLTPATKKDWAAKLTANFANELPAFEALKPIIKVTSSLPGNSGERRADIANVGETMSKIQTLVKKTMADEGMDYDMAFRRVQHANPSLFTQQQSA